MQDHDARSCQFIFALIIFLLFPLAQVRHVLAAAGRGPELVGHADPAAHGPASGAGGGGGAGSGVNDDDDDDGDLPATPEDAAAAAAHGGAPPEGYGPAEAESALAALRAFNAKWLSVLCAAYLAAAPEARAPFAAAIAAAAAVTPEAAVAGYFRAALQKLTKVRVCTVCVKVVVICVLFGCR